MTLHLLSKSQENEYLVGQWENRQNLVEKKKYLEFTNLIFSHRWNERKFKITNLSTIVNENEEKHRVKKKRFDGNDNAECTIYLNNQCHVPT